MTGVRAARISTAGVVAFTTTGGGVATGAAAATCVGVGTAGGGSGVNGWGDAGIDATGAWGGALAGEAAALAGMLNVGTGVVGAAMSAAEAEAALFS